MTRRIVVLLVLMTAPLAAAALAWPDVRVTPLVREGRVWVSCRLAEGFTPEVREAVLTGLPITFTYVIELRRSVPFWPDRTLRSATIAVSVAYDTLTRRHQLGRTLDGRVEANKVTEDEAEVKRWLTGLEAVPLFATSDLEANTEYYVRVRARTQPHDSWFFWPWDRGLVSNANFTFIP